jgi:hypothetical protein
MHVIIAFMFILMGAFVCFLVGYSTGYHAGKIYTIGKMGAMERHDDEDEIEITG